MDESRQLEIDLLCGVIDALPCPAALLNRNGQPAYVGSRPCPVDLDSLPLEDREDVIGVLVTGEPSVSRTLLEDSTGSAWGLLELYPVKTDGQIVGALLMFHPEERAPDGRSDALPAQSEAISALWIRIRSLSVLSSPVLFLGEDGVGKYGFARAMHDLSAAKNLPFVEIGPQSPPGELRERAVSPCALFARRIDRWPAELLDALADILGVEGRRGNASADCRILASSGPELAKQAMDGRFPGALYKRLSHLTVYIPALRERPGDILSAAGAMLEAERLRTGKTISGFSEPAAEVLAGLPLPGNLRELAGIIAAAADVCPGGSVLPSHLPVHSQAPTESLRQLRQDYTVEQILNLLEIYGDSVDAKRRAADELGIGLSTLYRIVSRGRKKPPGQ